MTNSSQIKQKSASFQFPVLKKDALRDWSRNIGGGGGESGPEQGERGSSVFESLMTAEPSNFQLPMRVGHFFITGIGIFNLMMYDKDRN